MRIKDSTGYRGTLHDSPNLCCILLFLCAVNSTENKNTSSKSQRGVSLLKQILVSRNELREIENYFNENSRLTCNKQLTSQKLLCTGLYSLVVCVKSPHSLVRVFTKTTREYNPVRRNCYDVNYIYEILVLTGSCSPHG